MNICVDKFSKKSTPVGTVVVPVHFRPTLPYPGFVFARGLSGQGSLNSVGSQPQQQQRQRSVATSCWTQKPYAPAYNLRALAFPSTNGPYTYGIATGLVTNGAGPDYVVGTGGNSGLGFGL
jgi:hypothetical protein